MTSVRGVNLNRGASPLVGADQEVLIAGGFGDRFRLGGDASGSDGRRHPKGVSDYLFSAPRVGQTFDGVPEYGKDTDPLSAGKFEVRSGSARGKVELLQQNGFTGALPRFYVKLSAIGGGGQYIFLGEGSPGQAKKNLQSLLDKGALLPAAVGLTSKADYTPSLVTGAQQGQWADEIRRGVNLINTATGVTEAGVDSKENGRYTVELLQKLDGLMSLINSGRLADSQELYQARQEAYGVIADNVIRRAHNRLQGANPGQGIAEAQQNVAYVSTLAGKLGIRDADTGNIPARLANLNEVVQLASAFPKVTAGNTWDIINKVEQQQAGGAVLQELRNLFSPQSLLTMGGIVGAHALIKSKAPKLLPFLNGVLAGVQIGQYMEIVAKLMLLAKRVEQGKGTLSLKELNDIGNEAAQLYAQLKVNFGVDLLFALTQTSGKRNTRTEQDVDAGNSATRGRGADNNVGNRTNGAGTNTAGSAPVQVTRLNNADLARSPMAGVLEMINRTDPATLQREVDGRWRALPDGAGQIKFSPVGGKYKPNGDLEVRWRAGEGAPESTYTIRLKGGRMDLSQLPDALASKFGSNRGNGADNAGSGANRGRSTGNSEGSAGNPPVQVTRLNNADLARSPMAGVLEKLHHADPATLKREADGQWRELSDGAQIKFSPVGGKYKPNGDLEVRWRAGEGAPESTYTIRLKGGRMDLSQLPDALANKIRTNGSNGADQPSNSNRRRGAGDAVPNARSADGGTPPVKINPLNNSNVARSPMATLLELFNGYDSATLKKYADGKWHNLPDGAGQGKLTPVGGKYNPNGDVQVRWRAGEGAPESTYTIRLKGGRMDLSQLPDALASKFGANRGNGADNAGSGTNRGRGTDSAGSRPSSKPLSYTEKANLARDVFGISDQGRVSQRTMENMVKVIEGVAKKNKISFEQAANLWRQAPELRQSFTLAEALVSARKQLNGLTDAQAQQLLDALKVKLGNMSDGQRLDYVKSLLDYGNWQKFAADNATGGNGPAPEAVGAGAGRRPGNNPSTSGAAASNVQSQPDSPWPAPSQILNPQPTLKPEVNPAPNSTPATRTPPRATMTGGSGANALPQTVQTALDGRLGSGGWSAADDGRGGYVVSDSGGRRVGNVYSFPGNGGQGTDWFFRPTGGKGERIGNVPNQPSNSAVPPNQPSTAQPNTSQPTTGSNTGLSGEVTGLNPRRVASLPDTLVSAVRTRFGADSKLSVDLLEWANTSAANQKRLTDFLRRTSDDRIGASGNMGPSDVRNVIQGFATLFDDRPGPRSTEPLSTPYNRLDLKTPMPDGATRMTYEQISNLFGARLRQLGLKPDSDLYVRGQLDLAKRMGFKVPDETTSVRDMNKLLDRLEGTNAISPQTAAQARKMLQSGQSTRFNLLTFLQKNFIGVAAAGAGIVYLVNLWNTPFQNRDVGELGAPADADTWKNANREYLLSPQFQSWVTNKRKDPAFQQEAIRYFPQAADGKYAPSNDLWFPERSSDPISQASSLWNTTISPQAAKLRREMEANAAAFKSSTRVELPYVTSLDAFYASDAGKKFMSLPEVKRYTSGGQLTNEFFASPERVAALTAEVRLENLRLGLKRVEQSTALDGSMRSQVGEKIRQIEQRRLTASFTNNTDSANSITSLYVASNGARANAITAERGNIDNANTAVIAAIEGKAASARNTLSDFSADANSKLNAFSAQIAQLQTQAAGLSPNASQNNAQRLKTYDEQIKLLTQATGIAQNKLALIDAEIARVSGLGGAVPASMTSARQAAQGQIDSLLAQTQNAQSARTQLQQSQANQQRADSNATRSNQVSSTISTLNGQVTQLQQENARLTVSINDLVNRRTLLANTIQSSRSRVEKQFTDGVRGGSASISLNPEVVRNATGVEVGLRVSQADAARLYQLASAGAIAWASVDPFIDRQGGRKTVTFASDTDVASLGKLNSELTGLQTKFAQNNSKITELNRQIANVRKQVDQGGSIPRPTVPAQ